MAGRLKVCGNQEKIKSAYANISSVRNILKWNSQPCNEMILQTADFVNRQPLTTLITYDNKMPFKGRFL